MIAPHNDYINQNSEEALVTNGCVYFKLNVYTQDYIFHVFCKILFAMLLDTYLLVVASFFLFLK